MTAPTTGNHAETSAANASTRSVSLTITASATAVIAVLPLFDGTGEDATIASVVLDPGGANESNFTFVDSNQSAIAATERIEIWILTNPPDGTFTITATANDPPIARFFLSVAELFDADTATPTGATAGASGNSDTASVNVTTTADESLVMGGIVHRRGQDLVPATGITELMDRTQTGVRGWSGYDEAPTTGAYTIEASTSGADAWNALAVEVLAVAEAGHDPLVADAGSYTVTGQDADLVVSRVLSADAGSYAVTGQDVTLLANRLLEADAGSYALSGQDATLLARRVLDADAGTYTVTGRAAALLASRILQTDAGAYTVTGQDVELLRRLVLATEAGNYTVTGQDATLLVSRLLNVEAGSYTLTGHAATLTVTSAGTLTLELDAGSYALTGHDVTLLVSRLLTPDAGSYVVTGQDAAILRRFVLEADAGSYTVTGQDAGLVVARVLSLEAGSYAITGKDATLSFSGETIQVYTAEAAANPSPVVLVVSNITPAVRAKANPSPDKEIEIA